MKKIYLSIAVLFFSFVGFSSNTLAQSVTVENAGTIDVNGHYTYLTTYNSKPYFQKDGSSEGVYCVYIGGGPRWQISNSSGYAYYINTADTPLPPQNGWIVCPSDDIIAFPGLAPAPTLTGDGTFPVELTSFVALIKGKNVELEWNTATEVNNYGFEIERKPLPIPPLTGEGIKGWGRVGFVEGAGTTNAPKSYSFVDASATEKVAYRLKQIDRDGKFEYSQEVEVVISQTPQKFALMQNYPNPFNPTTAIGYQLSANSYTTLNVYDALGREVATLVNEMKEAGTYSAKFDGSKLSSGIYFYTLKAENFIATKKLLLMK